MRPERPLVAQRAVANHCPELVRPATDPQASLPVLTDLAERLAPALARNIAALIGIAPPRLRMAAPELSNAAQLAARMPGLAAAALLDCGAMQATVALDGAAVLQLVDRAFGGRGEVPDPLPDVFPLSAQMLVRRLGEAARDALNSALGGASDAVLAREATRLAAALPWAEDQPLATVELGFPAGGLGEWSFRLALPLAALAALDGPGLAPARTPAGSADPLAAPFAGIDLPLSAVLVDMTLPLSTVSALEPGAVLPVAVARAVPLRIGDAVIARGCIGAQDDRVAIQLTQIA